MRSSEFGTIPSTSKSSRESIFLGDHFEIFRTQYLHQHRTEKRIIPLQKDNPIVLSAIQREFEIGAKLNHRNIVLYHNLLLDSENTPYIELEFVDGKTLREFCNVSFKHSSADIEKILFEIIQGLKYMHAKGVFHLDLTPDNIMITVGEQCVKIIDFSHASTLHHTQSWGISHIYSAPELHDYNGVAQSDIFSFGRIVEFLQEKKQLPKNRFWDKIVVNCTMPSLNKRVKHVQELETAIQFQKIKTKYIPIGIAIICLGLAVTALKITSNNNNQVATFNEQVNSMFTAAPILNHSEFVDKSNLKPASTKSIETIRKKIFTQQDSMHIEKIALSFFESYKSEFQLKNTQTIEDASRIHQETYTKVLSEFNAEKNIY